MSSLAYPRLIAIRFPCNNRAGNKLIYFVLQTIIGSNAKYHWMKYKVN